MSISTTTELVNSAEQEERGRINKIARPILYALQELEGEHPDWLGDETGVTLSVAGQKDQRITLGDLRSLRKTLSIQ